MSQLNSLTCNINLQQTPDTQCIGESLPTLNNNFSITENVLNEHCDKINKLIDRVNDLLDWRDSLSIMPVGSIIPFRIPTDPFSFIVNGSVVQFSGPDILTQITTQINSNSTMLTLDENWAVCNGSHGTLDLRGNFIIGAGRDHLNTNYEVQQSGIGENRVELTSPQLPSHTHTYDRAFASQIKSIRRPSNRMPRHYWFEILGVPANRKGSKGENPIKHTSTASGSVGSGNSHENKPRSTALIYLQRIS